MDPRKLLVVLVSVLSLGISGCAAVLIGAGAAGGYALSKDSVRGHFDKSESRAFKSSLAVAKKMGQVTLEDSENGRIKAKIKEMDVTIIVKRLTEKTVELQVKARNKYKMPEIEVAQEVYREIEGRLNKKGLFF